MGLGEIRWSRATDAKNFSLHFDSRSSFQQFDTYNNYNQREIATMKSPSLLASFLLLTPTLGYSGGRGGRPMEDESPKAKPPPVFPTACVKFAVFDNPHCWGNPKQVVKYPTYKKTGQSPCCKCAGRIERLCTVRALLFYYTLTKMHTCTIQWPIQFILSHR